MSKLKLKQLAGTGIGNQFLKTSKDGSAIEMFDSKLLQKTGPLGYYATTYIVPSQTDLGNISPDQIKLGDMVLVDTNPWVLQMATAIQGTNISWTVVATEHSASSNSVAQTVTASMSYTDSSVLVGHIGSGLKITSIEVNVTTAFDVPSDLVFGIATSPLLYADGSLVDLMTAGTYIITPSASTISASGNDVFATIQNTSGKPSVGSFSITMTYQ